MSVSQAPFLKFRGFDANGNPLVGGQLFTYAAGTTNLLTTYTSASGTIPNTNPIILNSRGECDIFLTSTLLYKLVLSPSTDSNPPTNPFWTEDNVSGCAASASGNAPAGAGNLTSEGPFESGVGFTPGVTTTLTLSQSYVTNANVSVHFDGIYQGTDQYTLSGNNIIFNFAIPVGVNTVYIVGGTTLSILVPAVNSVTDVSVATNSKLYNRITGIIDIKDPNLGATGNGTTNDYAAFINSNSVSGEINVFKGNYLISSSVTLSNNFVFHQGAVLIIPTGVTITFNGGFTAPIGQCFNITGSGLVVFGSQKFTTGYPEWWGAVSGNSSINNAPFLNASHAACYKLLLQSATYFTTSAWNISTSNRVVEGVQPSDWNENGVIAGTQIAIQSGTSDAILVGLSSDPGSIGNFAQGIYVKNIGTYRTTPVVPPISGSEISSASGFRYQFVLNCKLEDCSTLENSIGFNHSAIVFSYLVRCKSDRRLEGTTTINDIYWGFFFSGIAPYYIESLYLTDCDSTLETSLTTVLSYGFNVNGACTDLYLFRAEADGHQYGYLANGTGASKTSIDNQLIGCIFDQSKIYGVLIQNQPVGSSFKIQNNYVVMSHTGSEVSAYAIANSVAAISLMGNEAIGFGGATSCGLLVNSCSSVNSKGNNWVNIQRPVALITATNCKIDDTILNNTVNTTQAAINLTTNCGRNVIDSILNGSTGNFPYGVALDSSCGYNEVRCSGLNPSGITGGSANKLIFNGTQITSAGVFGTTNLAQGIMN